MKIKDRIKSMRRVKASEIRPNPRNWRTHPENQQNALRGILAEIGIVDVLIARELEDGGLELIDGHLRADTEPDTKWPVVVLDVTAEEADKILATLDPLAAMAEADPKAVADLLAEIETESEAVQALLDSLPADLESAPSAEDEAAAEEPGEGPGLGNPVVSFTLVFEDDEEQATWYRFLRHLRDKYPEEETHAGRLVQFIQEQDI